MGTARPPKGPVEESLDEQQKAAAIALKKLASVAPEKLDRVLGALRFLPTWWRVTSDKEAAARALATAEKMHKYLHARTDLKADPCPCPDGPCVSKDPVVRAYAECVVQAQLAVDFPGPAFPYALGRRSKGGSPWLYPKEEHDYAAAIAFLKDHGLSYLDMALLHQRVQERDAPIPIGTLEKLGNAFKSAAFDQKKNG